MAPDENEFDTPDLEVSGKRTHFNQPAAHLKELPSHIHLPGGPQQRGSITR